MFQDSHKSRKLQRIAWKKFVEMLKYKAKNIRKNIQTNQQMVPIKQNMQRMRILLQRPKTRTNRMKMPTMSHNT